MISGWLSLRVRSPKEVGAWYEKIGLQVIGGRPKPEPSLSALRRKAESSFSFLESLSNIRSAFKFTLRSMTSMPSMKGCRTQASSSPKRPKTCHGNGVMPIHKTLLDMWSSSALLCPPRRT